MVGKSKTSVFVLAFVISLLIGACSNLDAEEIKEEDTLTPISSPEKSESGVVPIHLESGVEGYLWIGPMCPVVHEGTECPDEPYETAFTITNVEGEVMAIGNSDADGFFHIPLHPGSYIFVPESGKPGVLPTAEPVPFDVEPDTFTFLEITFDSGIR